MKQNESKLDRIIRAVAGLIFIVLFLADVITGTLGIILLVVGILLLVTGVLGFCPIYALLKFRTNK